MLQQAGLGTLLLDLLTPAEERNRANVFDIELLARRLSSATDWLAIRADTSACTIGYFGASTGAGAALWAASEPTARIDAVVSRGGRPDLAGPRLSAVRAPTLLIVGSLRPGGAGAQPQGEVHDALPQPAGRGPGRHASLRRTGYAGGGCHPRRDWFVDYLLAPNGASRAGRGRLERGSRGPRNCGGPGTNAADPSAGGPPPWT